MSDLYFERLDTSSENEREAYERAFYAAFQRAAGNRLIRQLWQWDDASGRLATRFKFWRDSFAALRGDGFHAGYATTARRVLNLYRLLGAKILKEAEIEGEMRYFLEFDLQNTNAKS